MFVCAIDCYLCKDFDVLTVMKQKRFFSVIYCFSFFPVRISLLIYDSIFHTPTSILFLLPIHLLHPHLQVTWSYCSLWTRSVLTSRAVMCSFKIYNPLCVFIAFVSMKICKLHFFAKASRLFYVPHLSWPVMWPLMCPQHP